MTQKQRIVRWLGANLHNLPRDVRIALAVEYVLATEEKA